MTTFARNVLTAFADYGSPASRHEVFGDSNLLKQTEAIVQLCELGYLAQLPRDATADKFEALKYRVTPSGLTALGRAVPSAGMKNVSLNGKRKHAKV